MKKNNCSKKQLVLVVSILITTLIVTTHFYTKYRIVKSDINEVRVVSKIDDYSYFLDDNKSKKYIKYFSKLRSNLSKDIVNEEEYASIITKLFLIDFYSLGDKMTNQDVGGLQFIHPDIVDNFKLKAKETIYKYIENNIYSSRKQELPIVSDVNIIEIKNISLEYLNKTFDNSFEVNAIINYEKDLGYVTDLSLFIVHDGIKLCIVKVIENN